MKRAKLIVIIVGLGIVVTLFLWKRRGVSDPSSSELNGETLSQAPTPSSHDLHPPKVIRFSNARPVEGAISPDVTSATPDCGANSLFVFLKSSGVPCLLSDIRASVPTTGVGASLKDLKECASTYGLSTSIVKIRPTDLHECIPCILLLSEASEKMGHFVVLSEVGTDEIVFIDGTTGMHVHRTPASLERSLTGYALILDSFRIPTFVLVVLSFVVVCEVIFIAYEYLGRRRAMFSS
jgi:hypothetical protein